MKTTESGKIIFTPRRGIDDLSLGAQETLYHCTELVCTHWSYGTSYTIMYGLGQWRMLLSGSVIHHISPDVKITNKQGQDEEPIVSDKDLTIAAEKYITEIESLMDRKLTPNDADFLRSILYEEAKQGGTSMLAKPLADKMVQIITKRR